MKCLYCLAEKNNSSKEHIIPRQLGSFDFSTIKICEDCNNMFGKSFESTIANISKLKSVINCNFDDSTLEEVIEEFSTNYDTKRFLLKICFNFLYLLLPQKVFFDLKESSQNSINFIRNYILNKPIIGNDLINFSILVIYSYYR